ncbi:UNVERIFIED_CONTAM: hypothetical protein Sradi_1290800 [Sesamum radiatum]|uniref:Uncharacterized protein n=1 Tax=Sesamum radiatum TaxID=300843 RepID=A0AAW2UQE2_SESRA
MVKMPLNKSQKPGDFQHPKQCSSSSQENQSSVGETTKKTSVLVVGGGLKMLETAGKMQKTPKKIPGTLNTGNNVVPVHPAQGKPTCSKQVFLGRNGRT